MRKGIKGLQIQCAFGRCFFPALQYNFSHLSCVFSPSPMIKACYDGFPLSSVFLFIKKILEIKSYIYSLRKRNIYSLRLFKQLCHFSKVD